MDTVTGLLLVLACVLFVVTLYLGWLLVRPQVAFKTQSVRVATPARRPEINKCNMRRFSFARDVPEGTENDVLEVHPHCQGVPFDALTEDYGRWHFQRQHEGEDGWTLVSVSDHVHFLKPS